MAPETTPDPEAPAEGEPGPIIPDVGELTATQLIQARRELSDEEERRRTLASAELQVQDLVLAFCAAGGDATSILASASAAAGQAHAPEPPEEPETGEEGL